MLQKPQTFSHTSVYASVHSLDGDITLHVHIYRECITNATVQCLGPGLLDFT